MPRNGYSTMPKLQSSKRNTEQNGILLYGTNAVGKSSLIRSIGICVIMAQAGLFVPCTKFIYKPYKYSKKLGGKRKILILPRCRKNPVMSYANVPKSFYITLIKVLCDEFPDYEIKTRGLNCGSYSIWNDEIRKNNYLNGVRDNADLQDTIDECQLAKVALGSQSSLPKITLLQGIPTFMVGHQKDRHIGYENWMNTRAGFYEVAKNSYADFDFGDCLSKIVNFTRECL